MANSFVDDEHCGPASDAPHVPKLLHLYQHSTNHGDAAIVGNVQALTALRDALTLLIDDAVKRDIRISVVPGDDGEGYSLRIYRCDKPITDRFWVDLPSHYEIVKEGFSRAASWAIESAFNQRWMCEKCNGFGLLAKDGSHVYSLPIPEGEQPKSMGMFMSYDWKKHPDAVKCDAPLCDDGRVPFPPHRPPK